MGNRVDVRGVRAFGARLGTAVHLVLPGAVMTGMERTVQLEEVDGLRAVVVRVYGDRVRVAVDPAVVDEGALEVLLSIYG